MTIVEESVSQQEVPAINESKILSGVNVANSDPASSVPALISPTPDSISELSLADISIDPSPISTDVQDLSSSSVASSQYVVPPVDLQPDSSISSEIVSTSSPSLAVEVLSSSASPSLHPIVKKAIEIFIWGSSLVKCNHVVKRCLTLCFDSH
ncbi:hypothetical protein C6P40_002715 [Pichia californica]|uniref:Uncharacterized protein n=1 Tax=Pichia californica TaxID=460514 RepID=A0A9P7BIA8_9ASCO|nr:hypothetical protein C6P40_002715 [[Candida] californica]